MIIISDLFRIGVLDDKWYLEMVEPCDDEDSDECAILLSYPLPSEEFAREMLKRCDIALKAWLDARTTL